MDKTNSAQWAIGAGIRFSEVARTSENPTTKQLAEGLRQLCEAIRALGHEIEQVDQRLGSRD